MVTPKRIDINGTGQYLDAVQVDQGLGNALRETVVVADPTTAAALGAVKNAAPDAGDYGLVVRTVGTTTVSGTVEITNDVGNAIPVSETDGSNVVLGATTDAAVTTNTTGTLSAKLRGIVAILSNVWNSVTSRLKVEQPSMSMTASGFNRTASLYTLFDGKTLVADDTFKWDTVGTGSTSFANNAMTMSVTSGQYVVRQAKHWNPYFSGKPELIETTYIDFQYETNVYKRVGYFSSSAVAPYTASFDGIYLESDGVNNTYRLVCVRAGTETHNIPWASWDNYAAISGYDWSKFTVDEIDFLWLGGAAVRLFMVVNGVFTLIHTIANHAGTQAGLIILSPNQPVRYEIRSTTGSGSFTAVCSQVATEGGLSEEGEELAIYSASLTCNAVGTIYALKGVRKSAAYRMIHVDLALVGASISAATTDSGVLLVLLNPTLSAPLTWAANSRIEEGTVGAGQTITAGTGRLLACIPMNTSGAVETVVTAGLRSLPVNIDNTAGQIILAYQPTTANQNVTGQITVIEY